MVTLIRVGGGILHILDPWYDSIPAAEGSDVRGIGARQSFDNAQNFPNSNGATFVAQCESPHLRE